MQHYRPPAEKYWRQGRDELDFGCPPHEDNRHLLDTKDPRIVLWLATTTSCMDLDNKPRDERIRHSTGRYAQRAFSPDFREQDVRSTSQNRQVSRGQWEDIPLPYRPTNWQDQAEEYRIIQQSAAFRVSPPRRRRQPEAATDILYHEPLELQRPPQTTPAFLYPQPRPYYHAHSTHSAPDAIGQESQRLNRTVDSRHMPYDSDSEDELDFATLQGIDYCPPAGTRPARSDTNGVDDTFSDEDAHLFALATAGLGPDIGFQGFDPDPERHRSNVSSATALQPNMLTRQPHATTGATQQPTQMPQASYARRPQLPRLRTEPAAVPVASMWFDSPSPVLDAENVSPVIDDQPPDYAESQAQAQSRQALAARRRAQELQRRWQQSHQ